MRKVLIIEDEFIVSLDLEETLSSLGCKVVGTAANPEMAKKLIRKHNPEIIFCDINLNADIDGIHLMEEMRGSHNFQVVYLTAYHDNPTIKRALGKGNNHYLVKPFNQQQLQAALHILDQSRSKKEPKYPSLLSVRELEIVRLLSEGNTSQEIADKLNVSYHTVTTHTKNIRKKLNLHSILDVVTVALKNNWV
jgi:DNA-binding NarL/FixJ family response regulator